jgi:hypothetical protein
VTSYDFAVVDGFSANLTDRATVPVLHLTVITNPGIFGLDDQPQVVALRTVSANLTEPPEAPTVFVAAPAWTTTRPPRQSAAQAMLTAILPFLESS